MSLSYLDGKTVLITGGTGSFGQACTRILLEHSNAARIIVFSRDELKQSQMQANIPDPDGRLRFFIGDIRDKERLDRAFRIVDFVFHGAALKQVPMVEYNPFEAVKTNILGTQNVINAALDQGVEKVLLISTDKAANPANLYGATKACAEKLAITGNAYSGEGGTKFAVARYGNVLGSRGSLYHVIKEKEKLGRIPLTHAEMTRFWITLDQGVAFVLKAMERMKGGEIFVPKIPSMNVKEFIQVLAPNAELDMVGIRPGEKIHETLLTEEESRHAKEYDDHFVILPEHDWWDQNNYGDGKVPGEGYIYASDNNHDWLDNQKLMDLIDKL